MAPMKPMWRDGNVYGQVGELSGACYDAVCVYRRTEERDHAFVHHRSETVFVEPVERYDAQDSKRAYSDEYMDGVYCNLEHRAVVQHRHLERNTRAHIAYDFGRSGVVGVPLYERRSGSHAAQLYRHIAVPDHPREARDHDQACR